MIFGRIRDKLGDIRVMSQLLPGAEAAAAADGVHPGGAEYLVVAALDLPDGTARRAFERVGADPDQYPRAVRDQHREALRTVGVEIDDDLLDSRIPQPARPRGPLKSSPAAQQLFRLVLDHIRRDRSQLYGAYVVLVAAETEHGTVVRAIEQMGIDPAELAAAARAEVDAARARA